MRENECQHERARVAFALSAPPPSHPAPVPLSPRLRSYLLSPDDQFYIPPNNVYRLENHSTTETCRVFWTIIKHHEMEEADDE